MGSLPSLEHARHVRDSLPDAGLFSGHEWRVSARPFPLSPSLFKELEFLGRILLKFYQSVDLLHRHSSEGRQPEWIAQWLNQGKPDELLSLQNHGTQRRAVPRVIRPDVLLTENGFAITELDSVPGGIGLTAWLNQAYASVGHEVIGGPMGMVDGFRHLFSPDTPNIHVTVSEEASTYRPEMEWLVSQLRDPRFQVRDQTFTGHAQGDEIYRFFELFDLPNIPAWPDIQQAIQAGRCRMTPPARPMFEEKMLMALFWNGHLSEFWRTQLGEGFVQRLKKVFPQTWIVDPTPLPPHGAIPGLNLVDWRHLKLLSQRDRQLILKVSGFSEEAWGARGVFLGSNLSAEEWSAAVDRAIRDFTQHPYVLQTFEKPGLHAFEWANLQEERLEPFEGRVRLCPYYFVHGEAEKARAHLRGVLATVCPADKKIIHGMTEAVLAPCFVANSPAY